MFTDDDNPYRVLVEHYAERHFIKDFQKSYRSKWDVTRKAIIAQLSNIDLLVKSGRIPAAIYQNSEKTKAIYKHSFAVAGRKESPKSSGNRAIVFVDHELKTVRVLLVYSKNHIGPPNETVKWQQLVETQYPDLLSEFR